MCIVIMAKIIFKFDENPRSLINPMYDKQRENHNNVLVNSDQEENSKYPEKKVTLHIGE